MAPLQLSDYDRERIQDVLKRLDQVPSLHVLALSAQV